MVRHSEEKPKELANIEVIRKMQIETHKTSVLKMVKLRKLADPKVAIVAGRPWAHGSWVSDHRSECCIMARHTDILASQCM